MCSHSSSHTIAHEECMRSHAFACGEEVSGVPSLVQQVHPVGGGKRAFPVPYLPPTPLDFRSYYPRGGKGGKTDPRPPLLSLC